MVARGARFVMAGYSAAGVVELVDTQDLKSCSFIGVPVRFRPPAPTFQLCSVEIFDERDTKKRNVPKRYACRL